MSNNEPPRRFIDHLDEPIKYGEVLLVQKDGAAAVIQTPATSNERAGLVGLVRHDEITDHDDFSDDPAIRGVAVTETEDVADEKITIGEVLEAARISLNRPVELGDVAAIHAAEVMAIKMAAPGVVAAAAQSAAEINAWIVREEDKITVGEVLNNAMAKQAADTEVTRGDAEAVVGAEQRNRRDLRTVPGSVADSVTAAAARLDEKMGRF